MFILGHSQIDCIREAAEARGMDLPSVDLWQFENIVVLDESGRRLNDALRDQLDDFSVSVIGGGGHHVLGLVENDVPFDFVLPQAQHLPLVEGATIVPYDQVRATLTEMSTPGFDTLHFMQKVAPKRVVHLTPPPILRDERPINHPIWIARVGPCQTVTPPYFRLKLYLLFMEILREVCDQEGVLLLPLPPGTVDEEGFMLPRFAGRPCHTNQLYGEKVLEQLEEIANLPLEKITR